MKIEVRADNTVHIEGYVNVPGRDSRPLRDKQGVYIEQVTPGTFGRALARGAPVELRFNHRRTLGSTEDGTIQLREDAVGLHASAIVQDEELAEKARRKELRGWSFGFVAKEQRWEGESPRRRYLDDIDMRPMNRPQTRLWKGAQDEGTAGGWVPLVTYADFCFMAAEFTLEGVANTKSAQEWYEEGVRASLKFWSKIADYCKINNYEAITEAEIDEYMAQEGIAWNSAMAKEQIYCQTWIEHFKNNNESWAMYKRVGYPSTTSTLVTWEPIHVYGELQQVPRRKKFTMPADGSPNYANQVKRLEDMQKESNFGRLDSEHGRVWWEN